MSGNSLRALTLTWVLPLFAGCAPPITGTRTIVTGEIEPRHFQFTTIVEQDRDEPGGWRAACVHIRIQRDTTGESFICKFGIETPLRNKEGPISTPLAQRIAAERTNEAARLVFGASTPVSPLGMLCESFKATLSPLVEASIAGARVKKACHKKTVPVQFGELAL